ncbi:hypothetical protein ACFQO7_24580 [Catellatospora aurea]|uniref:Uncharacterized protein n=1 Tax=Catellatospora aurea TaxID=1337874 RepID=A0ABW2H2Z1_9ACTN
MSITRWGNRILASFQGCRAVANGRWARWLSIFSDRRWRIKPATSWNVAGRHEAQFPPALRTQVLTAYPRLGFAPEFLDLFLDQAARKPDGATAAAVDSGVGARMSANPLDA